MSQNVQDHGAAVIDLPFKTDDDARASPFSPSFSVDGFHVGVPSIEIRLGIRRGADGIIPLQPFIVSRVLLPRESFECMPECFALRFVTCAISQPVNTKVDRTGVVADDGVHDRDVRQFRDESTPSISSCDRVASCNRLRNRS